MSLRTLLGVVKRERFIVPSKEQMMVREQIADRLEEDIREMRKKGFSYYLENTPRHFNLVIGRISWMQSIFDTKSINFLLESIEKHQKEKAQNLLNQFREDLLTIFEDEIRQIEFYDVKYYLTRVLKIKALDYDKKSIFENHVNNITKQLAHLLKNKDVYFSNHVLENLWKSTQE